MGTCHWSQAKFGLLDLEAVKIKQKIKQTKRYPTAL